MKNIFLVGAAIMLSSCASHRNARWKTVDEGFYVTVPSGWRKKKVQGIDSAVTQYRGSGMELSSDWVGGFLYPKENSAKTLEKFDSFLAAPETLPEGEEVWKLDGKLALFHAGISHSGYGHRSRSRPFSTVFVPFEEDGGYLSVSVVCRDEEDAAIARKVLKSIRWKVTKSPLD